MFDNIVYIVYNMVIGLQLLLPDLLPSL